MRFGVQLFGTGEQGKINWENVFQQLALRNFQYFEPCIELGGKTENFSALWTLDELDNYMGLLQKAGLKVRACHIFVKGNREEAIQHLKDLIEKYRIQQIVLPCPEEVNEQNYQEYAEELTAYAVAVKPMQADLLLCHGKKEIETKLDGISAYEWLLRRCEGVVYAEPDIDYLLAGGEDPERFLWRNKEWIKSLHYHNVERRENKELDDDLTGAGVADLNACFQFARAAEIIQYLALDSGNKDMMEKAGAGREILGKLTKIRERTISKLCVLDIVTGEVKELHRYEKIIEAPNWLLDGDTLLYNSKGHIYEYKISEDSEVRIDSGYCDRCNNDHVPSPDNQYLAVSHYTQGRSRIYILPMEGGEPGLVTKNGPSYLHGWSPDGRELVYCAFRPDEEGKRAVDVYAIDVSGGEERQLTKNNGFNDGPEYSPDGKEIWFNSTRSGLMQIWKMNRDGSDQTQMTFENRNNWFAHISPDGKKVINISYSTEGLDIDEHLPNLPVELWIMNRDGSDRRRLLSFFGGQGSLNVNSWSPDSKKVAVVIYELLYK